LRDLEAKRAAAIDIVFIVVLIIVMVIVK